MKQRDILHTFNIKTGKTRCALYTHIKNNVGREIDWEKKEVLDKERDFEKGRSRRPYTSMLWMMEHLGIPIKVYQSMNAGLISFQIFGK